MSEQNVELQRRLTKAFNARDIEARRVTHPNDAALNRHVADAIARDTPRGWRLDKAHRSAQIDAVVALAMAVERAEAKPEPVALLGWV